MERYLVYEDYVHHMAFLRAALNRVLNFANTAPVAYYPQATLDDLKMQTLRAYKLQVAKALRTADFFAKVIAKSEKVEEADKAKAVEKRVALEKRACSILHAENRNVQRLAQILEVVIVGGRKGPDDFDNPITDADGNVLYKTDGEGNYVTELNEETGEMERIMRFSPPVELSELSHDVSGFVKYVKGYADLLEGKSPSA